jgi:hypothetical protein
MPDSPLIDGELINQEFRLHSLATTGEPMVHFSRTEIAEIVLFGADQRFNDKLLYIDKGITIRANGQDEVQLTRYLANAEPETRRCSMLVTDVVRNAAALGCDYGDLLKMVKDATETGALESRLAINALPSLERSYRAGIEPGGPGLDGSEVSLDSAADGNPVSLDDAPDDTDDARKPNTKKGILDRIKSFGFQ